MRICKIVNVLPNERTPGGGLFPYYLAKYIPEPTLYITRQLNDYRPLPPHVEVATEFVETTTPSDLRHEIFGTGRANILSKVMAHGVLASRLIRNDSRVFFTVLRRIRDFKPDLMICGSFKRLIYGIIAKYCFGCKLILSLHNTTETAALGNLGLLRLLIKIPDRVIAISPPIERELRRFLPAERIWLSSTGVDLEECSDWHLPRQRQLIAIGSFKWKKGYQYLLEAVSRVFQRYPDYRLLIAGEGPEREPIMKMIKGLRLESHVVLVGVLKRQEIVRALNESKLFVMASLHEGLPKALLEAIACGTPAVVTDGCNASGIIERTGISVPVLNSEALAEAIIRMLDDTALWAECSRNGPDVARHYDWKAVAARQYALYRKLLNEDS